MYKLAFSVMLLTFGLYSNSAMAIKIGWFNPNKVLKNTSAGKAVLAKQRSLQKKFERARQQGQIPLAKEQAQIEKAWTNLQKNQVVLTKSDKQTRLKKIKSRYDAWMKKVKQYEAKMMRKQQELTKEFQKVAEPFNRKLKRAAKSIAKSYGYDYILIHNPKMPQVLLYANPSFNITNQLIRKMK